MKEPEWTITRDTLAMWQESNPSLVQGHWEHGLFVGFVRGHLFLFKPGVGDEMNCVYIENE